MIHTWERMIVIPTELETAIRDIAERKLNMQLGEPYKWGEHRDFFIVRGAVKPHIDRRQKLGSVTLGFVVINDSQQTLVGNGLSLPIPPGSVYQLDGHEMHGTSVPANENPYGLLTFLAWDMPGDSVLPVDQFAREALDSVSVQFLKTKPKLVPNAEVYYNRSPAAQR